MGLKLNTMGRFLVKKFLVLGQPPGRKGQNKFSWLERDILKEIFNWTGLSHFLIYMAVILSIFLIFDVLEVKMVVIRIWEFLFGKVIPI